VKWFSMLLNREADGTRLPHPSFAFTLGYGNLKSKQRP